VLTAAEETLKELRRREQDHELFATDQCGFFLVFLRLLYMLYSPRRCRLAKTGAQQKRIAVLTEKIDTLENTLTRAVWLC
jgi:hypothetical protein